MRQIRELLRLHREGRLSARAIGRSLGIHHTTVTDILRRAQEAAIPWPLSASWDDGQLERRLYPGNHGRPHRRTEPDWPTIQADLPHHKGMTRELAW